MPPCTGTGGKEACSTMAAAAQLPPRIGLFRPVGRPDINSDRDSQVAVPSHQGRRYVQPCSSSSVILTTPVGTRRASGSRVSDLFSAFD